MIITTSRDNKSTHSVSSFVLKTNHAHKFFFLFVSRNAMVPIYSLRPVSTFLYIIINGNAIASFVKKRRFCGPKIFFLRTYTALTLPPILPPLYAIVRIRLDTSPPPLCVRTMWMTPFWTHGFSRKGPINSASSVRSFVRNADISGSARQKFLIFCTKLEQHNCRKVTFSYFRKNS